ncbi:MAG TPA: GNAT family N-acetyltransferase [Candidatus Acidoferrales bacterium]
MEKRKFFLESIPPHRAVSVTPREVKGLFRSGIAAIRYTCPETAGAQSSEFVCDDTDYGFGSLAADARRRTRRGLESCEVRKIDFDLLAREGCAINRSVFERHGRHLQTFYTDEARWRKYMAVCETLPSVEAYGAFVDGALCAFSLVVLIDDYAYLFHTHAHSDYLRHSPMNALFYSITKNMLERPDVRVVSQGLESFAARPELEHFKLAMGFHQRPIGRRTIVHPLARPIFSRPGAWVVDKFLKQFKPNLAEDFSVFAQAFQGLASER